MPQSEVVLRCASCNFIGGIGTKVPSPRSSASVTRQIAKPCKVGRSDTSKGRSRKLHRQTVVLPPKKPPIPESTEAVRLKAPRRSQGGCLVGGAKHCKPGVFHADALTR